MPHSTLAATDEEEEVLEVYHTKLPPTLEELDSDTAIQLDQKYTEVMTKKKGNFLAITLSLGDVFSIWDIFNYFLYLINIPPPP